MIIGLLFSPKISVEIFVTKLSPFRDFFFGGVSPPFVAPGEIDGDVFEGMASSERARVILIAQV